MAADRAFRIGVDADGHRLSGPHVVELRFLEVRPDPDIVGTNIVKVCTGCAYWPTAAPSWTTRPAWVCCNCGIGKVEPRLFALRFGLRQAGDGAGALGPQRLDLPLRQLEGRLRTLDCGLLLIQLRGVLLGVLDAARELCLRQILIARRLLLCEHQRRLLLAQLRLVRVDLGLLHGQLRINVFDVGLRSGHLRYSLGKCRAISTIVDASDHITSVDMLIVSNRDRRDVTRHFGGDGELARRYIGVVGGLEMKRIVPIKIAGRS